MTEKKLEKEAEEYAIKQWEGTLPWSVIQKSYYYGALPREKRIADLEAQIEKMKQELDTAREEANRQEQWELYSVLNDIYNDNFEVITSVSN